jgi:hypothetical protein
MAPMWARASRRGDSCRKTIESVFLGPHRIDLPSLDFNGFILPDPATIRGLRDGARGD